MTNTHKCAACGGWTTLDTAHMHHGFLGTDCDCLPCPVCLGVGSFSDKMPVSDAMADAETLLAHMRQTNGQTWWRVRSGLAAAWGHGLSAVGVVSVANAAFRAVPGLRG